MKARMRVEILRSYGKSLAKSKHTVAHERDLPFERKLIEQAILDELRANPDPKLSEQLKVAFISLDIFVTDAEFKTIEEYERITEKIARLPNTADAEIRNLLRVMEVVADSYVQVQRRVKEKQQETTVRLQAFLDSLNRG